MRNVKPGSIQAAVQAAIKAAGGLEAAGNDLGMSTANLSRASSNDEDRPGGLGVNHLHRLGRILPASAEPMAVHFAGLAGGVFQPVPACGSLTSDLSALMKEFADVVALHASAHSDASDNPSDFTPAEALASAVEVEKLIRASLIYKAALEDKANPQGVRNG